MQKPTIEGLASVALATDIEFPHLRSIALAQWIWDSEHGQNELFAQHKNAASLRWRTAMEPFGKGIKVENKTGLAYYCHFETFENFIQAYWRYLDRAPFDGWREHTCAPLSFIRYIAPRFYRDEERIWQKVILLQYEADLILMKLRARKLTLRGE